MSIKTANSFLKRSRGTQALGTSAAESLMQEERHEQCLGIINMAKSASRRERERKHQFG